MKVHCAACGKSHTINQNLAVALVESAQRGEMHTVGTERNRGRTHTVIYPRCILMMRREIERHGNHAGSDIPTRPLAR